MGVPLQLPGYATKSVLTLAPTTTQVAIVVAQHMALAWLEVGLRSCRVPPMTLSFQPRLAHFPLTLGQGLEDLIACKAWRVAGDDDRVTNVCIHASLSTFVNMLITSLAISTWPMHSCQYREHDP